MWSNRASANSRVVSNMHTECSRTKLNSVQSTYCKTLICDSGLEFNNQCPPVKVRVQCIGHHRTCRPTRSTIQTSVVPTRWNWRNQEYCWSMQKRLFHRKHRHHHLAIANHQIRKNRPQKRWSCSVLWKVIPKTASQSMLSLLWLCAKNLWTTSEQHHLSMTVILWPGTSHIPLTFHMLLVQ